VDSAQQVHILKTYYLKTDFNITFPFPQSFKRFSVQNYGKQILLNLTNVDKALKEDCFEMLKIKH